MHAHQHPHQSMAHLAFRGSITPPSLCTQMGGHPLAVRTASIASAVQKRFVDSPRKISSVYPLERVEPFTCNTRMTFFGREIYQTKMFSDVRTVLSERKHLKMVIR